MDAASTAARVSSDRSEYRESYDSSDSGEEGMFKILICVRVRVYATQSTHKTLTSLRQGSMIHVL